MNEHAFKPGNQKASRSGAPGKRREASRNGAQETEPRKAPILILQKFRIKWEGKEGSGVLVSSANGGPHQDYFAVAVIDLPVFRAT